MIEARDLTARAAPLALKAMTFTLEAGLHAALGTRADGVALLLSVLAGREPARAGSLRVLGAIPGSDSGVRARIGFVPLGIPLAEAWTAEETLRNAARIRGESEHGAASRLAALGIASLARRRLRTLTPGEVRGVVFCEALTSTKVRVLLVEEPFVAMDPRVAQVFPALLRQRAREGACIVIATASTRDAVELADDHLTFECGALLRRAASSDPVLFDGPRGAEVYVTCSDARALLAALVSDGDVGSIDAESGSPPTSLVVRGAKLVAVAAAIARAARAADVDIHTMRPEPLPLDELRAAATGDLAGAYRVAFDRARATPHALPPASDVSP